MKKILKNSRQTHLKCVIIKNGKIINLQYKLMEVLDL